jgi:predicted transposase/invertase (TIGR01784 family)
MAQEKEETGLYLKPRKFKKLTKDEISIRRDIIFKIVFGSNERSELLKDLLESLLHRKITNIVIRNEVSLDKIYAEDKSMRLDILAEVDGKEKINVELQNRNEYNIIKRAEVYASRIVNHSLKAGEDYSDLPNTIIILILGYNEFKNSPYHEVCHLKKESDNEIVSDSIVYHYIQLPKFIEDVRSIQTREEQWLAYLSCQLNDEEKEELFKMNEKIKNVDEIVKIVMENEEVSNALDDAILEKNLRQLIGARGYENGEKASKIQIAKKMKAKNKPIEEIMEFTELSKEEIEKL